MGKGRVLVVDDDMLIHQIITDALQGHYEIDVVASGEAALESALLRRPDLIILDIEMPGLSGIEVCKTLKEGRATCAIPVVLISSHTNEEEILTGLRAGADDYLTKPIYPPEVLSRVDAHLKHADHYAGLERDDLKMLLELQDAIASQRNPEKILRVIVDKFAELIDVDRCSIVAINRGGELTVKASSDLDSSRDIRLDLSRYPEIRKAYDTRRAVVVNDIGNDPLMDAVKKPLQELGLNSMVVVPVMKKEIVIGTMFLGIASKSRHGVSERIYKLCHLVANISANALESASLFDSVNSAKEFFEGVSIRDGLTKLYNHCHFFDSLEREFSRSKRYQEPLSLIFFDIDDFKQVNDRYGHMLGDHVLRELGTLLRRLVRENDIPARYGGEEFAILLPNTPPEGAVRLAERINSSLRETRFVGLEDVQITLSTGVAFSDGKNFETADQMLHLADTLTYEAKQGGKDRIALASNIAPQAEDPSAA